MHRCTAFTCVLCIVALLVARELSLQPDGVLHAVFFDVGQGDSILLTTPLGNRVLIDGGPDMSVLERLGEYMPFFQRSIELLVLTHPDADHITALPEVLRRYHVRAVLMTGTSNTSSRYRALLHEIELRDVPVILSDAPRRIHIEHDLFLDILWPPVSAVESGNLRSNDSSVVMKVSHSHTSLLLTGDIEERSEYAILSSGIDIGATVLKVPHHGSKTSSSSGFLLAIHPDLAVISVGHENDFGHPHPNIIERYRHFGIPVRMTRLEGSISLSMTNNRMN